MRSAVSVVSVRSGRSGLCLTPRIEHGDEISDICAGEGADEYVQRKRASRNPPASGSGSAAGAAAAVAGRQGITPLVGPNEEVGEDGELSYYEEGSRVQEVEDTFANMPTPTPVPATAEGEGEGEGEGANGGKVMIRSQRSNSSEGWVDQYTNSSVGGSREDLAGVEVAQSAAAGGASSNE